MNFAAQSASTEGSTEGLGTMRQHQAPSTAIVVTALIFYSTQAHSTPRDIVSIGGTSVSISATTIDFSSLGGPNAFDVGAASSGTYGGLGGTAGTIQNVVLGSGLGPRWIRPCMPRQARSTRESDQARLSVRIFAGCVRSVCTNTFEVGTQTAKSNWRYLPASHRPADEGQLWA
jgi:hypothetical protein